MAHEEKAAKRFRYGRNSHVPGFESKTFMERFSSPKNPNPSFKNYMTNNTVM